MQTIFGKQTTFTFLGHATWHIRTPEGKNILLDAWLGSNPICPVEWKTKAKDNLHGIILTHAHGDHMGDLVSLAKETGCQVACQADLVNWFKLQGVGESQLIGFNKGGMIDFLGVELTMTDARHSSTHFDGTNLIPMGESCGYVLEFSNDFVLYYTGDTSVSADMQIIGELYKPDVVLLPIGDHFTMGARQAAYALKLIGARYALPTHYGSFPLLRGTPEALHKHCETFGVRVQIVVVPPGESVN